MKNFSQISRYQSILMILNGDHVLSVSKGTDCQKYRIFPGIYPEQLTPDINVYAKIE